MEALNGNNETSSFQSNEVVKERQPQLQQKVDERRQSKEQTLTNTARSTSTGITKRNKTDHLGHGMNIFTIKMT